RINQYFVKYQILVITAAIKSLIDYNYIVLGGGNICMYKEAAEWFNIPFFWPGFFVIACCIYMDRLSLVFPYSYVMSDNISGLQKINAMMQITQKINSVLV
ncbi:MAG: hypothetical protein NUV48_05365, partial [Peptococcaceae bacterium]|nr:hypothetical protein [Peptococcaceae bacterium]